MNHNIHKFKRKELSGEEDGGMGVEEGEPLLDFNRAIY